MRFYDSHCRSFTTEAGGFDSVTTLSKCDRNALDKAVQKARDISEEGARKALISLGVSDEKKPEHLSDEQAELRRRVRVVLRRLGTEAELIRAVAYEQWHRMLFARFLIENDLLIHPEHQVPVGFEDLAELAHDEQTDPWELAARYASAMLPGIFKQDDPLLKISYAPEDRNALRDILAQIPGDTFRTSDALGWTYQFWQTKEKKRVNVLEKKIEGADLYAVTQLFTEPYMVRFLLQNSLGAWWLSLYPDSSLKDQWEFYKEQVQHDFSTIVSDINELTLLDPCCGSGHFLVEAFHMLLKMRDELGEDKKGAIEKILTKNLYGLEIDHRCVQIAAFSLALEAWKEGWEPNKQLPLPNLAWCGQSIKSDKKEWTSYAGENGLYEGIFSQYYDFFKNADYLGSLIPIENSLVSFKEIEEKIITLLSTEKGDPVSEIFGETTIGILKVANILNKHNFDLIVTNPPFLGYKKFGKILKDFCQESFPDERHDLSTAMLRRGFSFLKEGGILAYVSPQNWTFIQSYLKFREFILNNEKILTMCWLGPGAFSEISGEVVKVVLSIFSKRKTNHLDSFLAIDVSSFTKLAEKETNLRINEGCIINQTKQLSNPDYRIISTELEKKPILAKYAISMRGVVSGDGDKWIRNFWEIQTIGENWRYLQSTVKNTIDFGGREHIIEWSTNGVEMLRPGTLNEAYEKKGVAVSQMSKLPVTIYTGDLYDNNVAPIVPLDQSLLTSIWAFCNSSDFFNNVRKIDQSLKVTNATLVKVPFDLEYWTKVAAEKYPNGLPKPYSSDPTQWIFHGHPANSDDPIQVAIAKLLKYQWPAELDPDMELSDEQREWVQKAKELEPYVDDDGILCLPPVKGERKLVEYVRVMLAAAFPDWSVQKEQELLIKSGYVTKEGAVKGDLELYLRDEFFTAHCKLFNQRPFIWQIWDGRKDGFSVLVNYHLLDRKALEKLIYSYLGAWIAQQREEVAAEKTGAELRLKAAEDLKKKLILILEGESPYDIYVRWKPLHEQPIGWEPDLNDGVRMNIRPFVTAGVLRSQPKINWNKDRGKDPVPNCSGTTDRLNDLHFTLAEKLKAREEAKI